MSNGDQQKTRASNVIPFPVKKKTQVYVTESIYQADLVKRLESHEIEVVKTPPSNSSAEEMARELTLKQILIRARKLDW